MEKNITIQIEIAKKKALDSTVYLKNNDLKQVKLNLETIHNNLENIENSIKEIKEIL